MAYKITAEEARTRPPRRPSIGELIGVALLLLALSLQRCLTHPREAVARAISPTLETTQSESPQVLEPAGAAKHREGERQQMLTIPRAATERRFNTDPAAIERTLEELVSAAVAGNQYLTAARAGVESAAARVAPAGMPEDPLIGYRIKDLVSSPDMPHENATAQTYFIGQRYPFPGKLGLRRAAAGKQAELTQEELRVAELNVATRVRSKFADLFIVDKEIDLAFARKDLLHDLSEIALGKYRVGPGIQQDVLNANVAMAKLDNTLIELSRRRRSCELALGALLSREIVEVEPLGALPQVQLNHGLAELEQMVQISSADIQRQHKAVERDELKVSLAQRAALPDFAFEGSLGGRNDEISHNRPNLFGAQVMMSVPIFYWSKQREELREARANLVRSKARLEAVRGAALTRLHDLVARLAQHEQASASFRKQVIPLAESSLSAAISAYQVDQVDFLTLLAAQQNLQDFRTEYWRNQAERFRDLAAIAEITGTALVRKGWSQ